MCVEITLVMGRPLIQRIEPKVLGQITPCRVIALEQGQFPFPFPVFDLLFTRNCGFHGGMNFKPDETFDTVFLGMAGEQALTVLLHPLQQVGCDAGIIRAISELGHDVDGGLSFHW